MSTSNFNSATPDSAWFLVLGRDGQWKTVSTTGGSFVAQVQLAIKTLLGTTPKVTYDGSMIRASNIMVDRNWGPMTTKGLWAVINAAGGAEAIKEVIRISASLGAGSALPRDVVQVAANLIAAPYGTRAVVPANAITPPFRAIARGAIAPFSVRAATDQEISDGNQNPSALPDSPGADAVPEDAVPTPRPVPQVPAPVPAPRPNTPLPTGVPQTISRGSAISWGAVGVVAVGVVALGLLAASVRKSQKGGHLRHARANPSYGPKLNRVHLTKEPLDSGGYTRRPPHKYFGLNLVERYGRLVPGPNNLYRLTGEDVVDENGRIHPWIDEHLRADSREDAMRKVRKRYPNVRFTGKE